MSDALVQGAIVPVVQRDVVLMLEAGYVLLEMKKHKEAEELFAGVCALVPASEVPLMALGHLYFAMGRFSPALKSHQRALSVNPGSAAVHAAIAETLLFLKRPQEAVASIAEAVRLEPDSPAATFARALEEAHDLGVFRRAR